ncbi:major facilitator superfamily domain-containing protein 6 [Caerostris extrusa]|uniref:Major facilitator superfamily domain-containing protein 6 n=1 Tax=Caerostris extrusa TaxID=172846 RepID=A0AAV4XQX7_CAEEX|nr:major facilitator superfamily domain-containing protein 6 [Caerostris extrusa]
MNICCGMDSIHIRFFTKEKGFGFCFAICWSHCKDRIKLSATSFATIMVFQQFLFVFTKPTIECKAKNTNSSVRTKRVDGITNVYDYPLFNSWKCSQSEKTLKDSCAILIHNCIICCSRDKDCSYTPLADASQLVTPSKISDFETYQFWICALVFVLLNACENAIFTLSNTACCESIKKNGADFGKQRLWGAVGWGLLAPLVGCLEIIQDPWLVLLLNGCTELPTVYFYTSIATYAKKSAKPGTETTTQAVVFATYDGLGAGIGNIVAGLGFDYLGAQQTFFYSSIFFFLLCNSQCLLHTFPTE